MLNLGEEDVTVPKPDLICQPQPICQSVTILGKPILEPYGIHIRMQSARTCISCMNSSVKFLSWERSMVVLSPSTGGFLLVLLELKNVELHAMQYVQTSPAS